MDSREHFLSKNNLFRKSMTVSVIIDHILRPSQKISFFFSARIKVVSEISSRWDVVPFVVVWFWLSI